MPKLMLVSYSGLSDRDANGITIKKLLSAWKPEELCQFYCGVQEPDFSACQSFFRVTDVQMIKSFLGKGGGRVYRQRSHGEKKTASSGNRAKALPNFIRKHPYNFFLKWVRELMWLAAPWGRKRFMTWAEEEKPDALFYMVGESIFMDRLVLRLCEERKIPLILYNCEAFRVVDVSRRRGLDRLFYKKMKKLYRRLNERACLTVFNCQQMADSYEAEYSVSKGMLAYNCGDFDTTAYTAREDLRIAYFGSLGVGRTDSILDVARALRRIDPGVFIDVYGKAAPEDEAKLRAAENIRFHGFVSQQELRPVKESADILLHAESFDPAIAPKLKYAFSTKIAQCLCAGRCFFAYAPAGTISTRYLLEEGCAVTVTDPEQLEGTLRQVLTDPGLRERFAARALETARKNHSREATASAVRKAVEDCVADSN